MLTRIVWQGSTVLQCIVDRWTPRGSLSTPGEQAASRTRFVAPSARGRSCACQCRRWWFRDREKDRPIEENRRAFERWAVARRADCPADAAAGALVPPSVPSRNIFFSPSPIPYLITPACDNRRRASGDTLPTDYPRSALAARKKKTGKKKKETSATASRFVVSRSRLCEIGQSRGRILVRKVNSDQSRRTGKVIVSSAVSRFDSEWTCDSVFRAVLSQLGSIDREC